MELELNAAAAAAAARQPAGGPAAPMRLTRPGDDGPDPLSDGDQALFRGFSCTGDTILS